MNLTEQEKRSITLEYLQELSSNGDSTKVTKNIESNENEIRNKKFFILYRAFYEDIYMPELKKNKDLREYNMSNYNIQQNKFTNKRPDFWGYYRDLRNTIMHSGVTRSSDFCYISEEAFKNFEAEVYKYINPPTAYDISTKENLFTITDQCNLSDVLKTMAKENYSNAPVMDNNDYVKGMFSANTLLLYANKNEEVIIDCPKSKIEDFKPLYEMNEESEIIYDFIAKDKTIYDVNEKFEQAKKNNKRLEAIFVTEKGDKSQKIMGIITPWDMLKYLPDDIN